MGMSYLSFNSINFIRKKLISIPTYLPVTKPATGFFSHRLLKAGRLVLLFTGLSGLLSIIQAQNDAIVGRNIMDHLLYKNKYASNRIDRSDIEGSPYLHDSFTLAMVTTSEAVVLKLPLKYNIYEDVMEFQDKERLFLLEPSAKIQKIEMIENTFTVEPYEHEGKLTPGYFIHLETGKVKLLLKKGVRFQEAQAAKAMEAQNKPAKYETVPDQFYFKAGTREALPITNVKKMIAHFPDHQKSLLSFADRRKLGKKKEDLIKLWEYYNGLEVQPK